jgi:microcystin-dependent protein
MSDPFVAEIRIFAGNFAPRNWAFCNGQLLPIAQHTALFSLIGTTYGGDGRTTTALPDLQGRAPMHPGNGPGLTSRRLGQKGGTTTETLSEAQMPSHDHALNGFNSAQQANPAPDKGLGSAAMYRTGATGTAALANEALAPAGGAGAHNNVQPLLGINFIIALLGTFPSR